MDAVPTHPALRRVYDAAFERASLVRRLTPQFLSTTRYKYQSTQINLPPHVAERVLALGRLVRDEDLAEDGRESEPHVTVKYGLNDDVDADRVRRLIAGFGPFAVSLGRTAVFQTEKADVVFAIVDSDRLRELNRFITDALPGVSTHPSYTPHATIAYVRPGLGRKYADDDSLDGAVFVASEIVFCGKDGTQTPIPLG